MKIQKFVINNFKGIKHTVIEVSTQPPGNVITLIGLNESGKTTVLEAISNFVSADRETSSIVRTVMNQQRPVDLIPKALETNFTGEISVRADVELDDSDVDDLAQALKEELQVTLDKTSCPRKFFFEELTYSKTATSSLHITFGVQHLTLQSKKGGKNYMPLAVKIEKYGMQLHAFFRESSRKLFISRLSYSISLIAYILKTIHLDPRMTRHLS